MDKVLKRRLIGASILIALAVIFIPMLLVDPDSVDDSSDRLTDVPPMPESAREVRRIPLDPEAARVASSERGSSAPEKGDTATRSGERDDAANDDAPRPPDDEIVLRPDLTAPEPDAAEESAVEDVRDDALVQSDANDTRETGPLEQPDPDKTSEPEAGPTPVTSDDQPRVSMGDWVVQVASFGSQDSANQVRSRLEALGHIVARDEIVRGQSLLYRLRTGPYPSRAAAEQALAQISATVEGVEPIVREMDREMREGMAPGFAVQVGSFVSEDNADNETERLNGLGFDAFRFSEQVGERMIWRVLVGPVPERSLADELESRLADQAGVEGLVVSYP